jgi:hypothetical protein
MPNKKITNNEVDVYARHLHYIPSITHDLGFTLNTNINYFNLI